MEALRDLYESDQSVFEQRDVLYQEELSGNKKGLTYTESLTGLSQAFPDYRKLPGDQSVAGAALQYVKRIINIQPDNEIVKSAISEIYKILEQMENGEHIPAKSFITTLGAVGFERSHEGGSAYLKVSDTSTIRLSNHPSTASTFRTIGEDANNLSLVVQSASSRGKNFKADDYVNLLELQFGRKYLDEGRIPILLADIASFLATGEYIDNVGALHFDVSGNMDFKRNALENLYASAVHRGDDNAATKIREVMYQTAGASVLRGATSFGDYFNQNYRAVITLFEGAANASTLVHESAHWLKGLMEALCTLTDGEGNPVASEGLREELASIEKWLDNQKYNAAAGTPEYRREREEKFARAFEYYVMNGKAPAVEVTNAFATLKHYLKRIYKEIISFPEKFGFEFNDEIRQTFDSLFATLMVKSENFHMESLKEQASAQHKGEFLSVAYLLSPFRYVRLSGFFGGGA